MELFVCYEKLGEQEIMVRKRGYGKLPREKIMQSIKLVCKNGEIRGKGGLMSGAAARTGDLRK